MKIVRIEDLHCNAGWRDFSFLKITTDDGLVGWSEYNEGYGSAGITAVIRRMALDLNSGTEVIGRPIVRRSRAFVSALALNLDSALTPPWLDLKLPEPEKQ